MKRIEFIAPVEAMRGNLSGNQTLVYPTADNKAFESPESQRNYARNYRPSFVGAKRASDGLKYFAVKTKSAVGMTAASKLAMAALGGAASMAAYFVKHNGTQVARKMYASFKNARANELITQKSVRAWLTALFYEGLKKKAALINVPIFDINGEVGETLHVDNPWQFGDIQGDVLATIPDDVRIRFWGVLSTDGIYFQVEGVGKGIAIDKMHFSDFAAPKYIGMNVLNLNVTGAYVKSGNSYLLDEDGEYIAPAESIYATTYTLTEVAPA